LRERPHLCIAGNHDWATLGKLDLEDFNADARRANLWNRERLSPENLNYLDSLPETLMEGEFTLVHGSPRFPIWEYIIYGSTALDSFAYFHTSICFVGHTHIPVIYRLDEKNGDGVSEEMPSPRSGPVSLDAERLIINPGSVGQPRDGNSDASYAILDTEALTVEHRRVAYPIEVTQEKMREYGLPSRLVTRLQYGW
jgi:diadenosine tetraphosphatase ApaH/serine/threonine PP2A family protein phosphatase